MRKYAYCIVKYLRDFDYNRYEVVKVDKHYDDYVQIGLNIMRFRKERGLTQEQLADVVGYTQNHIQRVETAVSKPTVGLLLDLSRTLNIPIERLMEIRK